MGGLRLGRYELLTKLATGGMAEIWLATQSGPAGFSKQLVVKKILPHLAADRAFVEMFLNEGRYAALINHPNVVQVFELGEEAGSYFLVMEHVAGFTLREVLNRMKERGIDAPIGCVAALLVDVCRGLHAAHELVDASKRTPLGLVHRDVSPENVLLSRSGQAKVTDFGIAKAASAASMTRPGETRGKIAYMPPEQLLGEAVDRRADVYAVGATLFELATGRRPFVVPADAALSKKILEEPAPELLHFRPDAPVVMAKAVERALAKAAGDRWPDTLTLAKELEPLAATSGAVSDWLTVLFPEGPATVLPPVAVSATNPLTGPVESAAPPLVVNLTAGSVPTIPEATPAGTSRRSWVVGLSLVAAAAVGAVVVMTREPELEKPTGVDAGVPVIELPREVDAGLAVEVDAGSIDAGVVPVTPPPAVDAGTKVDARKPKGKGKILVRVSPWADVLIDGNMVGATPLGAVEVSAGRHRVTVTNSELGKTKTVTVEVRPGRQELVQINLKP